jgi:CO/xanthine dehydrogenase FAD-binding subunit
MKPAPFEYHAPRSIEQALELMREQGDEAKILAGGQSLVPAMNFRVVQPSVLVDINRVPELGYIREDGNVLRVGAMTRERQLEFDPLVAKRTRYWRKLCRLSRTHRSGIAARSAGASSMLIPLRNCPC